MPPKTEPLTEPDVGQAGLSRSGLKFSVASSLSEVQEAWGLVYQSYRREGLIDANDYGIHTTEAAVGPESAVILACLGPLLVGTLSAYKDTPVGLPLDTVYHPELTALRQAGRRLMEVGLFADRREHMNRAAEGLFELMRYAFHFALQVGIDDGVIGVHPRHAPFYMRLFSFERLGPIRAYPTVKDNAVVLLRIKLRESLAAVPLARGIAYFVEHPVAPAELKARYRFDDPLLPGSPIGQFLVARRIPMASVA
jgi:hypothetical protein